VPDLPEGARPFFADPPSANVADFPQYLAIARLALARTEHCDLFLGLRAREFADIVWRLQLLRRCEQARIESELRPAARALLRDRLDDGHRSEEEVNQLVTRCVHLALDGGLPGLDDVRKLIPDFELRLVESEAIRRSAETTETLAKMQSLLETQKEKAITALQYEVESLDNAHRSAELFNESEKSKKSSKPQQVKQ
jgi:hypothetical protein